MERMATNLPARSLRLQYSAAARAAAVQAQKFNSKVSRARCTGIKSVLPKTAVPSFRCIRRRVAVSLPVQVAEAHLRYFLIVDPLTIMALPGKRTPFDRRSLPANMSVRPDPASSWGKPPCQQVSVVLFAKAGPLALIVARAAAGVSGVDLDAHIEDECDLSYRSLESTGL